MSEAFSNLIGDCIFVQSTQTFVLRGTRPLWSGAETDKITWNVFVAAITLSANYSETSILIGARNAGLVWIPDYWDSNA